MRKIDHDYFRGIKFPTLKVVRKDEKVYEFTEAYFDDLNTNDIHWLFNEMKRWNDKNAKDRYVENCLKRFIEGQVKKATMFDFQIALKSGEKKVNLTEPSRFFEINEYRLWSIVNFKNEGKRIVYSSPHWNVNLVMLFK